MHKFQSLKYVFGSIIFLLTGLFTLSASADVYYTQVVELNEGVTIDQIAQAWQKHKSIWKKKGHDVSDTALSTKVVGAMDSRRMSFYFKAKDFGEYGAITEEFFDDPDWQEMSRVWDSLRVIVTAEIYQTID
jgi:hypothetical protein